jgi:hypothetical protein
MLGEAAGEGNKAALTPAPPRRIYDLSQGAMESRGRHAGDLGKERKFCYRREGPAMRRSGGAAAGCCAQLGCQAL